MNFRSNLDNPVNLRSLCPRKIYADFLFRQEIKDLAPFVSDLIRWEDERQANKLIFIPSQSYVPGAVREALGSRFQNLYAEGYPPTQLTHETAEGLQDIDWHLANYRRYADRRFYKGKEYANILESLAQRKAARLFVGNGISEEEIRVNVQALSGTPANLGVYWSLMEPGDTLMGLDLYQGGHLSHGSEFNVSGQRYRVVSYGVNPETERLDYQQIRELALAHQPRIIVAGYTSYPWAPDWTKFREIADACGAYLMADISHVAGMVCAGVYPNPIGLADVITFTTHKTMMGPRGAAILTTDEELADKIDLAIFPGEQGGPHVNKIAAMAVAFEIAGTEQFQALQKQIVKNARALADGLSGRGLRLAYGGTETHLLLLDLKSVAVESASPTGIDYPLWGEPAVRILDLAGLVANKNTIPGDLETSLATGIRLGTPWLTQRGLVESHMDQLAGLIHQLLSNLRPFAYNGLIGTLPRAKVDFRILEEIRFETSRIASEAGIDFDFETPQYPHNLGKISPPKGDHPGILLRGFRAKQFLNQVLTGGISSLGVGDQTSCYALTPSGELISEVLVLRMEADPKGRDLFKLAPAAGQFPELLAWLRDLGDGYVLFDSQDIYRKIEGPVVVEELDSAGMDASFKTQPGTPGSELLLSNPEKFELTKPYFIGQGALQLKPAGDLQPSWSPKEADPELKRTELYDLHLDLGRKNGPLRWLGNAAAL